MKQFECNKDKFCQWKLSHEDYERLKRLQSRVKFFIILYI